LLCNITSITLYFEPQGTKKIDFKAKNVINLTEKCFNDLSGVFLE